MARLADSPHTADAPPPARRRAARKPPVQPKAVLTAEQAQAERIRIAVANHRCWRCSGAPCTCERGQGLRRPDGTLPQVTP